jgi:tetratricopeptide (TPR) repeat protein
MAIEVTDDPRLSSQRRSRRPVRPLRGQPSATEVPQPLFPEEQPGVHSLYTVAMMGAVLRVPPAAIRHWQRCGLLEPSRRSTAVTWFEFSELVVGRQLARLLRAGLSPSDIADQLSRLVPGGPRAAAQVAERIVVEGRRLYVRRDGRLLGAGGQLQLGFANTDRSAAPCEAEADERAPTAPVTDDASPDANDEPATVTELLNLAADLEAAGALAEAAEALRAVLQAQGPTGEVAFMLAEVLYRSGDLTAARERYYAAVELDGNHLEARASLGCVLAELGEHELALAALEEVIRQEPGYADAHWHIAAILHDSGRETESRASLKTFLALAPESPWATMARERLTAAVTPPT